MEESETEDKYPLRIYLDSDAEAGSGQFSRCFEDPAYCSTPARAYISETLLPEIRRQARQEAVEVFLTFIEESVDFSELVDVDPLNHIRNLAYHSKELANAVSQFEEKGLTNGNS